MKPVKLTKVGEVLVESLNKMAAAEFSNRGLPNHTPYSPLFWFAGLAREWAGPPTNGLKPMPKDGKTPVFEHPGICALLTDETVLLLRELGIKVYVGRRVSATRKAELAERRRTFCACLADPESECHECPAGTHYRCYDRCLLAVTEPAISAVAA